MKVETSKELQAGELLVDLISRVLDVGMEAPFVAIVIDSSDVTVWFD